MSKGKLALGVAAGLFAAYMFASPYITVYQIKSAAENNDATTLSEYIDFPSLRQSYKGQITAMLEKDMAENEEMKNNPFAKAGAALGGRMVEQMVDAYVTPARIVELISSEKPALEPRQSSIQSSGNATSSNRKAFADASLSYESLDKFVINVEYDGVNIEDWILRRQGLFGWKITNIVFLPAYAGVE
ncbi:MULTISPECIES: DUF2939 domain-containing protein [Aeromonas]|uniref:DUF2939 domain-containing protein n=1 Tax=Aeromonas TaxID=642 RepID=UPI0014960BE1|nr:MULTISPECIES: DUF2939 domain-containing protein [Aeromonas]MBA8781440.1 DUF2939 domain-containing protein [Aeromonas caviae]MBA8785495.1 DUF2939 domain-containing protein [Aeromonas sp. TW 6]